MFTNTTVNSSVLPAMAVRGIVPLPNNEIRLEVGRKESILALKEAASSNKYIALFVQKNPNVEKPTQEDVYKEGLVVKILYDMETANIHKVKVLGIVRCDSLEVIQTEPYWLVNIVTKPIVNDEVETELAHVRLLIKEIENEGAKLFEGNQELAQIISQGVTADKLTDVLAYNLHFDLNSKLRYLQTSSVSARLAFMLEDIKREKYILKLENEIKMKKKYVKVLMKDKKNIIYVRK